MAHGGTHPDKLDVSASINPLGLHPAAHEALAALSRDSAPLTRYPDSDCTELRTLLAQFWSAGAPSAPFDAAHIVCGAGAADMIYALVQAFARTAELPRAVVVLEPAFSEYARAADAAGVPVRRVVLGAERGFALTDAAFSALEAALDGASLLFAASPANPTGVALCTEELERLSALCEQKSALFVLDACFSQFSARAEAAVRALIARRAAAPHTVVLNACTKFYGMAGVRLGYTLCFSRAVSSRLRAVLRPWAVGALEQAAGSAVLRAELAEQGMSERDARAEPVTAFPPEAPCAPPPASAAPSAPVASVDGRKAPPSLALSMPPAPPLLPDGALVPSAACTPPPSPARSAQPAPPSPPDSVLCAPAACTPPPSAWTRRTRALVATERARLTNALRALGCQVIAGEANYVLFRAADTALSDRLLARGVAIRSCADFCGLDAHWYRVAVRTAHENTQLIAALSCVCMQPAAPH